MNRDNKSKDHVRVVMVSNQKVMVSNQTVMLMYNRSIEDNSKNRIEMNNSKRMINLMLVMVNRAINRYHSNKLIKFDSRKINILNDFTIHRFIIFNDI
jgi:hypothetical protein